MFLRSLILLSILGLLCGTGAQRVSAATITITSIRDNSIFADFPSNANGAGHNIYTGRGGGGGGGGGGSGTPLRRGFVAFDVAGSVPAGATIQSAQLTMHLIDYAENGPTFVDVNLHRVLANWGEGTSDAGEGTGTGTGTAATTNDTTWTERFYNAGPATPWTTAGGDFVSTASATQSIGPLDTPATDFYSWETTGSGGLVADVQLWLDNPGSNFGWAIVGDESQVRTTRRFHSREDDQAIYHPALFIQYTLGSSSLAAIPEPSSLLLCGIGLVTLLHQRRTRRVRA